MCCCSGRVSAPGLRSTKSDEIPCSVRRNWHETNSFCPVATDLDAFRRFALVESEALLSAYRGTNTEIGGFVAEAKQQDFELIPTLFAGAIPSGLVSRAALNHLVGTITARVRQGGFDGVFLAVHGAMVAEGIWEADACIVQQVRDAIGPDVPLVVTFDLHANRRIKRTHWWQPRAARSDRVHIAEGLPQCRPVGGGTATSERAKAWRLRRSREGS